MSTKIYFNPSIQKVFFRNLQACSFNGVINHLKHIFTGQFSDGCSEQIIMHDLFPTGYLVGHDGGTSGLLLGQCETNGQQGHINAQT